MIAYMLDSRFLEESKDADIEAIGYTEFTEFANKRFGWKESIKLFAELVTFHQKNSPYDNEQFGYHHPFLIHSYAAERKFSTFRFIHNKIRNHLQNDCVKKLVFIYGNLWNGFET
ncbi:hypothetical protein RhiirA1_485119 [Rhizophagus irregularis]|uniref:Uncharacterized protein n=1 Tax=Rhizophagus irregularis TaxID=588596 RepID=A0A2I1FR59_9GLOM|nr:hypothetical protein RhiirA1_485119 [Rhizophagus irregularis]PKY36878.1 hypothetical protein RhiirB3_460560 [Rhizophagus irregularis]